MKQAIFFGESPSQIFSVYPADVRQRLRQSVELPEQLFSVADLGERDFSRVEFIFATWGVPSLTRDQWRRFFPSLRCFFYGAGATDAFARELLASGVRLSSAWRANAIPVAEYTVAAILLGLKNFYQLVRTGRSPEKWFSRPKGRGANGATVTLLGSTGAIATLVAEKLKSYDLEVIGIPSVVSERKISLEEAFSVSQAVSNHLPDRNDNAGCIGGKLFSLLPEGAFFLNTGRGRQINEKEMIEVLKKRPDLTVLLDVQYPEPPEKESELYTLPNVFMTPHIAGSLGDELRRMGEYMATELELFVRDETLAHEVFESSLLTWGDRA